jgi:HTH-type transcriptional regulator / antitoxin HigA
MANREVAEAFRPGEFIMEELEARNWSQIELSEIIGRDPKVINDVILGKRPVTTEIAKALGEAFGTSAQYWMNLESSYRLWLEKDTDNVISRRAKLYQMAPIKEMIKRHWIEPSGNVEILERQVMRFFGVNNLEEPINFRHAARRGTQEIIPSQNAWLFRANQLARAVQAKTFSDQSFKNGLDLLRKLLTSAVEVRHVPRILAEAGIRFVVLEQIPQSRIDGVTFWLDSRSPVIVLSLRYDRIDWFWYTLAHELSHVKQRDGLKTNVITLDTDLVGDDTQLRLKQRTDSEKQADLFAEEFLVPQSELDNFILRVQPLYGKTKIVNFAHRIGVHPGIVVGQLQFRNEIHWSVHRKLLEKVRRIITQSALTDGWGQIIPIFSDKEVVNA